MLAPSPHAPRTWHFYHFVSIKAIRATSDNSLTRPEVISTSAPQVLPLPYLEGPPAHGGVSRCHRGKRCRGGDLAIRLAIAHPAIQPSSPTPSPNGRRSSPRHPGLGASGTGTSPPAPEGSSRVRRPGPWGSDVRKPRSVASRWPTKDGSFAVPQMATIRNASLSCRASVLSGKGDRGAGPYLDVASGGTGRRDHTSASISPSPKMGPE